MALEGKRDDAVRELSIIFELLTTEKNRMEMTVVELAESMRVKVLQTKVTGLRDDVTKWRDEAARLKDGLAWIEGKVAMLKMSLAEVKGMVTRLRVLLTMVESEATRLRALLRWKKRRLG